MPVAAAITLPAFPRTSSATSGFFFCGMIEEVEAYRSSIVTKSNSDVDQRISSDAMRLRSVMRFADAEADSIRKSRALTASIEFSITPSKPSNPEVRALFIGNPVPANAAAPSGLLFVRVYAPLSLSKSRSSAPA